MPLKPCPTKPKYMYTHYCNNMPFYHTTHSYTEWRNSLTTCMGCATPPRSTQSPAFHTLTTALPIQLCTQLHLYAINRQLFASCFTHRSVAVATYRVTKGQRSRQRNYWHATWGELELPTVCYVNCSETACETKCPTIYTLISNSGVARGGATDAPAPPLLMESLQNSS